jgi:excisionase family DNA binding protein
VPLAQNPRAFDAVSIDDQVDTVMPNTTNKASAIAPAYGIVSQASRLAYGVGDAAEALGLSRSRLYELIAAGEIAACKVGKRTIIQVNELTAFLDRHRVERLPGGRAAPTPPPRQRSADR